MSSQAPLSKGVDGVYRQLRQQILEGKIRAGTVLQQVELAEKLGVSRTPVRHALQQLVNDGLVEFLPGQTARVTTTSLQDALEMRQIRLWLEVPALLLALRKRPNPADLIAILDEAEALGDAPTAEACAALVRIDEQFHQWVLDQSGNRQLEAIVNRLRDLLFVGTAFNIEQDYAPVRANLIALRDALRDNDLRRVRKLMIEHMTDTGLLTIEPIGFEDVG